MSSQGEAATANRTVEIGHSNPTRRIRVPAPLRPESVDPALGRDIFDFKPLDRFTWKERVSIRAADRAFHALIASICPTLRWEFHGAEHLDAVYRSGHNAIISFWHNRIFYATWFWRRRGIAVMTSQSFDGEYIARFIQRFDYGAARGSSTRGGGRALIAMDRVLRAGFDVAFTVDGPKGPVYEAKPGPVLLARRSGQAIVPMHVAGSSFIELKSWDRFQIPRPFSRAVVAVAEPIYVARDAGDAETAAAVSALQSALDGLRARFDAS